MIFYFNENFNAAGGKINSNAVCAEANTNIEIYGQCSVEIYTARTDVREIFGRNTA